MIEMKVIPRPDQKDHSSELADIISEQKKVLQNLFEKEGLVELPQPSHLPRAKRSSQYRIKSISDEKRKQISPLTTFPLELMAIAPKSTPMATPPKKRHLMSRIQQSQKFKLVPSSVPELAINPRQLNKKIFQSQLKMRMPTMESSTTAHPPVAKNVPELVTLTKVKSPKEKMKVLDSALAADARLYRDPKTGQSFFQIEITFNDDKPIESIPKDILFLLDASSSIPFSKLEEFKKGIKLGFSYLGAEDRYNIVTFREKPKSLFSKFVSVTNDRLQKTQRFIDSTSSSGKTDIYAGLAPFVSVTRDDPNRPSLIILVSDGRTTTGLKLQDRELIRRIFQENKSGISIFSFSAGRKANLFLMDFLSYQNRGYSFHVEKREKASHHLMEFIETLSDIVIADLTYKTTGNMQAEIYPKKLPHLFRRRPLTLFGKLTPGTHEIAVQIIGKNKNGEKEELVKRISLNTATPGGPELVKQWALQKIYHLLGTNIQKNSFESESEINNLALKYHIDIPY